MIKTIALCSLVTCVSAKQELKKTIIVTTPSKTIIQMYAEEKSKKILYATTKDNDRETYMPESQRKKQEEKQNEEKESENVTNNSNS